MAIEADEVGTAVDPYTRKVGERLRAIRRQKRLSLQEVEAKSNQEFKASVLGAYERGERAISVPRLKRLSRFYAVPVDQLLPPDDGPDFGVDTAVIDLTERAPRRPGQPVVLDLTRLDRLAGPEAEMLLLTHLIHSATPRLHGAHVTIAVKSRRSPRSRHRPDAAQPFDELAFIRP